MQSDERISTAGAYRTLSLTRDLSPSELFQARHYVRGGATEPFGLPIRDEYRIKNIVPTTGKNVLARRLAADETYSGIINYGALGSGSSAFTTASTQLDTEVFRKLAADSAFDDNIAYIDWYIASGDVADQTFEEFGAFIDGTASADTGQAFSLALTGGWVKSGALFISLSITIS